MLFKNHVVNFLTKQRKNYITENKVSLYLNLANIPSPVSLIMYLNIQFFLQNIAM